jgi:hypothetical protein
LYSLPISFLTVGDTYIAKGYISKYSALGMTILVNLRRWRGFVTGKGLPIKYVTFDSVVKIEKN